MGPLVWLKRRVAPLPGLSPARGLANLPIAAKVMLMPAVALVALGAISAFAAHMLERHHTLMVEEYTRIESVLVRSRSLPVQLSGVEADLYKLSVLNSIDAAGAPDDAIRRGLDRVGEDTAALERAGIRGASELRDAFGGYRKAVSQALVLIERDSVRGATALRQAGKMFDEVQRRARSVSARALSEARVAARRAEETSAELLRRLTLGALGAGMLVLLISALVSLAITAPVRLLVLAIRSLFRGDLSRAVPMQDRRDELGEVARAIAEFREALIATRTLQDERERQREELEHLAHHDPLTCLANRQGMNRFLRTALVDRRSAGQPLAFMQLDLDSLKPVNDAYGHAAGDAVLVEIAGRLKRITREGDLAARTGGDEFTLILKGVDASADAARLARRVSRVLEPPIRWKDRAIPIGASIGLALSGDVGAEPEALMAAADEAMYAAKRDRSTEWKIYNPADGRGSADDLGVDLERAIRDREMVPCYRPVVRLEDQCPVGLDVQVQWRRPGQPEIRADEYLPEIEERGLLADFTQTAAGQVLATVSDWISEGLDPGRVSFTVPGAMLASTAAVKSLESLFAAHADAASRLVLHLPEDFAEDRGEHVILANIDSLAKRGIRMGLARFGGRHGALALVRAGRFAELELDGSIVAGIGRELSSELTIDAANRVAAGLAMDCVAADVQTEQQERFLRRCGCRLASGELYGVLHEAEPTAKRLREAMGVA